MCHECNRSRGLPVEGPTSAALPIDDGHDAGPISPYSLSKRVGEILSPTMGVDGSRSHRVLPVDPDRRAWRTRTALQPRCSVQWPPAIRCATTPRGWTCETLPKPFGSASRFPSTTTSPACSPPTTRSRPFPPRSLAADVYGNVPWQCDDAAGTLVRSTVARSRPSGGRRGTAGGGTGRAAP